MNLVSRGLSNVVKTLASGDVVNGREGGKV